MSLHKLTAGSGYDYLTRQVAVQDVTEKGHASLASYYTEKGETPGVWAGSGLVGLDGLGAGDVVTEQQMQALFGSGHHPLAHARRAALADDASEAQVRAVTRLGTPFKVHAGGVSDFRVEVARRLEELNVAAGRPRRAPISIEDRARVRSEVGREHFVREHGRQPADARELAGAIARGSRPKATAVAGYDLTFSPVKSVSTLWAVADPATAAKVERAHDAAVADALGFIERDALYTRKGAHGARQVEVTGLVAAAFTHRDSRVGDPDLHTHVAVANKVQTRAGGEWLAIDGRVLFKAKVTASETYNTALERHLHASLGVQFAERPNEDRRKRPVREIVGVDAVLNQRWSQRRAAIVDRQGDLAAQFGRDHGRPPTPIEAIALAQQATLETRDAKHEPRTAYQQRVTWRAEAINTLGSPAVVAAMVRAALSPGVPPGRRVDTDWIAAAGGRVVAQVQQRRPVWQVWHLRSEAQRQVRTADLRPGDVAAVVDLIVDQALGLSVAVAGDLDPISDPQLLRRTSGRSVYHVAGSDLFTSRIVLAAEQRIVAAAGRTGGRTIEQQVVDLALAEATARGTGLNAGQAALVRGMATSGVRVQLGIAAAGTGKTTAMSVLTRAWEESGGTVIGLAPSAAAAAVLGEQTGVTCDTLTKLNDSLNDSPTGAGGGTGGGTGLAGRIGPGSLVLIDEAGMADTLTLDIAINHVLARGASVRLIGDDQQLAAIGAGGVLRDIDTTHGALRLSELMRFDDPAESAATLALRDGLPESLGYYLDHDRIHIGDPQGAAEDVFNGWAADRTAGLDSIMLAPTRDLVAGLNARARAARLTQTGTPPGPQVTLADGNSASAGDVVITRRNDRRLRVSATDWVKNGDRWTITGVTDGGDLTVRHIHSRRQISLPADYVAANTELGYASTVHTAQGVSVHTMHGLATGEESRQHLYTMMTRGKAANHLYLIMAGDGDPHSLIRPETTSPKTATDVLEDILARDQAPTSATSMARENTDPAAQLGGAAARYADALQVAAEDHIGPEHATTIDQTAEQLLPGIGDEPAWPVLRAHLMLLQAGGHDAITLLASAVAGRDLDGAQDRAAVLDWRLDPTGLRGARLDPTGLRGARPGPLPWLPAIPAALAQTPTWGPYLTQRANRVEQLAGQVRARAAGAGTPTWARQGAARPDPDLLAEVSVWRAANSVPGGDRRPTGPPQLQKAPAIHQRQLNERLNLGRAPALAEWGPAIDALHPRRDQFTPLLAERLAAISRTGVDAAALLHTAAGQAPLPDDHVAAALWWRISAHLSPTIATEATRTDAHIDTDWSDLLIDVLGADHAAHITGSPWWPTLVGQVDHARRRGWQINDLFDGATSANTEDVDPAQAIIWRISILTDPPPDTEPDPYRYEPPPADLDQAARATADTCAPAPSAALNLDLDRDLDRDLDLVDVARDRTLLGPLEPTDTEINTQLDRAHQWDHSPVPGDRILAINEMAADYYEHQLADSWASPYLHLRLGHDLGGDRRFRPGYAPAGWTHLIDHLHSRGVTDTELIAAGLAKTASTGRLIDRFRDRAVLPVITGGQVLGFVARRHPDAGDNTTAGPKYLNTPDTIAFHKGAQLYGLADPHMTGGAIPVLVEGPLDAIAVTIATAGAYLGLAPLGTSLTAEQATQLGQIGVGLIIATDGDLAGRIAAERDYWHLTPHRLDPHYAHLEAGDDPASLLADHGPTPLRAALHHATPLADTLIDERLTHLTDATDRLAETAAVIAARPPTRWHEAITTAAERLHLPADVVRAAVAEAGQHWNDGRRTASNDHLAHAAAVRTRIEKADTAEPADRWAALARQLDVRLLSQPDWPATAATLQQINDDGHDIHQLTRQLVDHTPLDHQPSQDLRYRLVGYLPDHHQESAAPDPKREHPPSGEEHERRITPTTQQHPDTGPRR